MTTEGIRKRLDANLRYMRFLWESIDRYKKNRMASICKVYEQELSKIERFRENLLATLKGLEDETNDALRERPQDDGREYVHKSQRKKTVQRMPSPK